MIAGEPPPTRSRQWGGIAASELPSSSPSRNPYRRRNVLTTLIRPATAEDAAALVALMTGFYAEAGYPLPASPARRAFDALLAEPRLGGAWLAEDGEAAVGYVVLTVSFTMEYGGMRGSVDDLYVQPRARGRGVAVALLAAVRSACAERDVRALQVEVGPDNLAARSLYRRAGYSESGHLLLSLPLAPPLHDS